MTTLIAGNKFKRSYNIIVQNPYIGIGQINYQQEIIAAFADGTEIRYGLAADIVEQFINPSESFNLLDPTTGAIIGVSSYQQVYIMLYSLYAYLGTKYPNL